MDQNAPWRGAAASMRQSSGKAAARPPAPHGNSGWGGTCQATKEFALRNVLLGGGSVGCAALAVLVCVFAASNLTVTTRISDVVFRVAEQQNVRRSELLDAYIDQHVPQLQTYSAGMTNSTAASDAASSRQQSANSMLGLSFSFVGPQFVISAGVAGAHEFCGVGAGTRSGQTTALLVLALCALLYACGGVVVFYRLLSQWDHHQCIAAAHNQVMHLTAESGPDLCQGRMLHVLCYLNEEVDCDIAVTSMSAFILASICSVLSAVSMLVSLIQIRAGNLRSRFRQAKRKGLQEPVSEHLHWAAEMVGRRKVSRSTDFSINERKDAAHREYMSAGIWPDWLDVFRLRGNEGDRGSHLEEEVEPLLAPR